MELMDGLYENRWKFIDKNCATVFRKKKSNERKFALVFMNPFFSDEKEITFKEPMTVLLKIYFLRMISVMFHRLY